ncbi:MAG: HEPN domain-containing protein [Promethearchaeota archaeon]|nr:MAG: HEPN domain-containing protein [Candidatus Lokiarchaeota archaeon]
MNRYNDWLKQAEADIEAAMDSQKNNHHEWACFQAQQSAEKALKALLLYLNDDTWGDGLIYLLKHWKQIIIEEKKDIEEQEYKSLIEKCQELDRHYIQPRYPNGFASGYPAEYYNEKTSQECIAYATDIFQFVKQEIKEISSSK